MSPLQSIPGLNWQLDAAAREVVCGPRRVRLAEKPFRVLQALVDARGEVVTRADLHRLLWTGDTFVDFENNLNSTVAALRHALAQLDAAARPIETIPKAGYRLAVASMRTNDTASVVAAPRSAAGRRFRYVWAAAAAVVVIGVAASLLLRSSGAPESSATRREMVDPRARDLFDRGVYLRGRYHAAAEDGASALSEARAAFGSAFRLDPRFAAAAAEEADTLVEMGFAGLVGFRDALTEARTSARRALELSPGQPAAARVAGLAALILDWDFTAARAWLDRAASGPPDARTLVAEGTWLAVTGRIDAAIDHVERAVALDPAAFYVRSDLAMFYLAAGRNAEAAAASESVLDVAPHHAPALSYAMMAHERLGRPVRAAAFARALIAATGGRHDELARIDPRGDGSALVRRWREVDLQRLEQRATTRPGELSVPLALRHAALGRRQAALDALQEALQQRDPLLVFLRLYPELTGLRHDPAFLRIARALGPTPAPG